MPSGFGRLSPRLFRRLGLGELRLNEGELLWLRRALCRLIGEALGLAVLGPKKRDEMSSSLAS
jgi:hypothetical protein